MVRFKYFAHERYLFMRRVFYITLLLILALTAGCATQKQSIPPSLRIVDIPPLNEERTSELGDTLVEKGKIYTYDAIKLENRVSAGDGFLLKKLTLEPCTLTASLTDGKRIYYSTNKLSVFDAVIGTQMQNGGLAISKKNENDIKFHLNGNAVMTPKPQPVITKTQVTDVERPSFMQELIYNGRSGDVLKFLYREYYSDHLRAPFTQEIQYDLNDGNLIGFKGVRIDVVEASNTRIRYRVLSSFPDSL